MNTPGKRLLLAFVLAVLLIAGVAAARSVFAAGLLPVVCAVAVTGVSSLFYGRYFGARDVSFAALLLTVFIAGLVVGALIAPVLTHAAVLPSLLGSVTLGAVRLRARGFVFSPARLWGPVMLALPVGLGCWWGRRLGARRRAAVARAAGPPAV